MIKIPINHDDLYTKTIDKCNKLIDLNYWDTLDKETLLSWLNNFETKEEKYLAISILNRLIFRNKKSIETFGANIFHIILPQILSDNSIYEIESIHIWETMLRLPENRHVFPFRFSTIEHVDNNPAKSGSIIYRQLQREHFDKTLGINCSKINNLPEEIKAIILFDDIIVTGHQFLDFYALYDLSKFSRKIIYIPLAGHKINTDKLNSEFDNVIIHPVEDITESCEFFNEDNKYLNQENISTLSEFLDFYHSFCKKKKIKIKKTLGHGDMGLTYCFSDSTPNNNLSLLSYKSEEWLELLKR